MMIFFYQLSRKILQPAYRRLLQQSAVHLFSELVSHRKPVNELHPDTGNRKRLNPLQQLLRQCLSIRDNQRAERLSVNRIRAAAKLSLCNQIGRNDIELDLVLRQLPRRLLEQHIIAQPFRLGMIQQSNISNMLPPFSRWLTRLR